MDAGRPLRARPVPVADLAARILGGPPRLGTVRLVCIDGPAGSGKTTLAGRLAAELGAGAVLVHFDDLYAGWAITGALGRLQAGVLGPLRQGWPGAYHRYDWSTRAFAPEPVAVPVPAVLLVEGCGSSPRALDPWTTLRLWVEAPQGLRLARGLVRDGSELEPEWRRWQATEAAEFAREGTRDRADVRLDGTSSTGGLLPLP